MQPESPMESPIILKLKSEAQTSVEELRTVVKTIKDDFKEVTKQTVKTTAEREALDFLTEKVDQAVMQAVTV